MGDLDFVLDLCRDRRRRIVLGILATERRSLTLTDLTKVVLKHDHQTPATDISEEIFTPIQLSLHHHHIPKLTTAGVVEYDTERHLVDPTERFEHLEPYLSEILAMDPGLDHPVEL